MRGGYSFGGEEAADADGVGPYPLDMDADGDGSLAAAWTFDTRSRIV